MTEPAVVQKEEKAVAVVPKPKQEIRVVEDNSELSYLLDTARMEHNYRLAARMAASSFLPTHLRGANEAESVANCFLVLNQALRWGMDPFAVMPETYAVKGKLGYQGKLVAALVNSRANIKAPLSYEITGDRDDMNVVVSGTFKNEDHPRTVRVDLKTARTQNEMWTKDPGQKLCYTGAVKWARRHCPEILLGVAADDDVDRMAQVRESTTEPERTIVAANVELVGREELK